ncbi:MAG: antibiotic biosynthesis monooxygenase [SAR86 cluster bacterium]|uniref:Antibiotic biosynthesis monooxygenase n=1 Tax=SAR86 cluster bacterium TaxID=2030880 RepID=A0A2A5CJD6_9GAMM|nr:MAG: antibiotic biosynthesis monooxygenase [SAR86 cluster bacterium]
MSILVHLEVNAKLESISTVKEILARIFPDTRAYDGCIDITAYLEDNEHTFLFIENWESKEHYARYLAWREESGSLAELGEHLQGPPVIRYFENVDA